MEEEGQQAQALLDEENRLKAQQEEQAKRAAEAVSSVDLSEYEARLRVVEGKIDTILFFFQQGANAVRGLPTVQLPPLDSILADLPKLESTTRQKIVRLVDAYAAAKMVNHQEIWKHLYGQLSARCHFDPWQHSQNKKDPNYLEIVEEHGHIENLYTIAQEVLSLKTSLV